MSTVKDASPDGKMSGLCLYGFGIRTRLTAGGRGLGFISKGRKSFIVFKLSQYKYCF